MAWDVPAPGLGRVEHRGGSQFTYDLHSVPAQACNPTSRLQTSQWKERSPSCIPADSVLIGRPDSCCPVVLSPLTVLSLAPGQSLQSPASGCSFIHGCKSFSGLLHFLGRELHAKAQQPQCQDQQQRGQDAGGARERPEAVPELLFLGGSS